MSMATGATVPRFMATKNMVTGATVTKVAETKATVTAKLRAR